MLCVRAEGGERETGFHTAFTVVIGGGGGHGDLGPVVRAGADQAGDSGDSTPLGSGSSEV